MHITNILESVLTALFLACYAYQIFYVFYMLLSKKKEKYIAKNLHRFGIIISARNEEEVIKGLLRSIKAQDYPSELINVYVVADNCDDKTAEIARKEGAYVIERFNKEQIGKGYALDLIFKDILADENNRDEGFIVLDADNVLSVNYVREMNNVFDQGYRVITSYRNSKNYDSNWISAGYSLWFLRESKYLNNVRMNLKTSCAISGTGFLVHKDIIRKNNGWKHHLLTEDIEFTADSIINGELIGYAADAELFDEQPVTFRQSFIQRLRWSKGFYQVLGKYGKKLAGGIKGGCFACYDMLMTIAPAMIITILKLGCHIAEFIIAAAYKISPDMIVAAPNTDVFVLALQSLMVMFSECYGLMFFVGIITTITEWKHIHCENWKKIAYVFTFPLFMLTYLPVSIWAIIRFKSIGWTPIKHSVKKNVDQITQG